MKVQPVSSPHMIQPTGASSNSAAEAKARAVAKLTVQPVQPQQTSHSAQLNQNAIAPEDITAVKPATQASEPEIQPEPQAPEKAEDPALSRQFARLAQQEKALRAKANAQDQAMKAKEAALAAREAELQAKDAQYRDNYIQRDLFKQDPLTAIEQSGVTWDELTRQALERQPTDPRVQATINQLKAQVEELKQANEQNKRSQQDAQTQAYQAAVKQIRTDIQQLVATDPAFETIKATKAVDDVVELITRTYDKDGILLSVEDAASQVEDYLVEEALKITKIDKIQKRMASTAKPTPAVQAKTEQQQPTMKTLTNSNTSSRKLSAKERAILAFRNELK